MKSKYFLQKDKQTGFSLVELIISIAIISTALLGLVGLLTLTIPTADKSSRITIAKEIAISTLETLTIARESQVITFDQISNDAAAMVPGIFPPNFLPIRNPGPDNLFGTADDNGNVLVTVGPKIDPVIANQKFDSTNDQVTNLTQIGYQRRITITDLGSGLKQVTVDVFYPIPSGGVANPNTATAAQLARQTVSITTVFGKYRTSLSGQ